MNAFDKRRQDFRQWVAARTAKMMFFVSLVHLVCLACLVVLWVDVPGLQERAAESLGENELVLHANSHGISLLESFVLSAMAVAWSVVALESIIHWASRPWDAEHRKYHWFGLGFVVCPSLRLCARSPEMGHRLWLPGLGWRRPDKRLRRRLERRFGLPMLAIALMILPILVIEFLMKDQVAHHGWLRLCLHLGTGVIWFAFAAEFILMVSVADRKLAYCKKHWIDLAIILLPLFSFLRSLRALRATRIAKLMRIPQIGKLARIYRLRGTAVKAIQALILLDAFHRWRAVDPEKQIVNLQQRLNETESQARRLRRQIAKLKRAQERNAAAVNTTSASG